MSLRIGIFHATLPEPNCKPGGVDVFVHRLANQLVERGHTTRVLSYSPPPEDAAYELMSLGPTERSRRRLSRMVRVPLALNRVDRHVRTQLDLLHLHGDDWFYVSRSLPTVRTFYGSAAAEGQHATAARQRWFYRLAAPLEGLSARLATASFSALPDPDGGPSTIGSLPIGVDLLPERTHEAPRSAHPSVLFVGTWHGRKRGHLLHRVFEQEVLPSVPGAELWMVSDRCDPAPGITWFPQPTDQALSELFQRAWVFCSTSVYEGFGIPALEAMAAGVPVVSTPNPGIEHVSDRGRCARVVADADLGRELVTLLSRADLRRGLGKVGRKRAEHFRWSQVIAEHEAAYRWTLERWRQR